MSLVPRFKLLQKNQAWPELLQGPGARQGQAPLLVAVKVHITEIYVSFCDFGLHCTVNAP